MGQGLAAIAENVKKRKEAEAAASGKTPPPVAGLKAAAPKPSKPAAPKVPAKSTSALTSDVDRLLAGYEDTTGVAPKKK